jgi:hypothetical protein
MDAGRPRRWAREVGAAAGLGSFGARDCHPGQATGGYPPGARAGTHSHRPRDYTTPLGYGSRVCLAEPVIGPAEGRTRWLDARDDRRSVGFVWPDREGFASRVRLAKSCGGSSCASGLFGHDGFDRPAIRTQERRVYRVRSARAFIAVARSVNGDLSVRPGLVPRLSSWMPRLRGA